MTDIKIDTCATSVRHPTERNLSSSNILKIEIVATTIPLYYDVLSVQSADSSDSVNFLSILRIHNVVIGENGWRIWLESLKKN